MSELSNKEKAVIELSQMSFKNRQEFFVAQRKIARKYGVGLMSGQELVKLYQGLLKSKKIKRSIIFEKLIRKRAVRTMSGIAPVAVLTKPYPCPGKCAYCPTEKDVPQSYFSNEPAVMRAIRCGYNPYAQVQDRLRALVNNGHEPTKIELIVIGGTWSYLPKKYKYWYVLNLFRGANNFKIFNFQFSNNFQFKNSKINSLFENCKLKIENYNSLSLKKIKEQLAIEQKRNERAKYKIIGLTLETRPDYIDDKELLEMRNLGCTRVEIGVQAIDNKILKLNKRGHDVQAIVDATKLLKDYGFKVTYHIMPGLPGATPARDFKMFKTLFVDARFQPDQIKFYPCVVTKGSLLYRWWKQGKYKPYTDKQLRDLIIKCKRIVPEYVRIIRLIRDIPGESILAGNKVTNLRQVMQDKGVECGCIRCRECKDEFQISNFKFQISNYRASGGEEYFISCNSKDGKVLYGFCRLRLSKPPELKPPELKPPELKPPELKPPELKPPELSSVYTELSSNGIRELALSNETTELSSNTALIRELHVYGELASVGSAMRKVQHSGLGEKLLKKAEEIAKKEGYTKMKIISGVGVRGYYRKHGYRLNDTYMVKRLNVK